MEGGESDLEAEESVRASCEGTGGVPLSASGLRAKVSANLSTACMYLGDLEAAGRASVHSLAMAARSADPAAVAGVAGSPVGGVRAGGMDERATLADRMYTVGRESRDPADVGAPVANRCGFERGDLAAVSRELEPLAHCAAELRTPVARWHLLQARAVLAAAVGRFADSRLLADRAVAALPPSAAGRESAQVNRSALLSLVGLHTGEASDLTGLLDYGPGHEDGDGLDFPVEGVIFSIAAAFFLAHGGQLAQAATVYRRLGPLRGWRPTPHATTSCFAFGIGTAIALNASDDVSALHGRLASFRGRHVADGGAGGLQRAGRAVSGSGAGAPGPVRRRRGRSGDGVPACAANRAGRFRRPVPVRAGPVLSRRARRATLARARTLGVGVVEQASALGMVPWARRAGTSWSGSTTSAAARSRLANARSPRWWGRGSPIARSPRGCTSPSAPHRTMCSTSS